VRPPADAGRALDIAGSGRGADQRAEHRGETVGDQRLFHPRQIAIGIDQTSLVRRDGEDADERAAGDAAVV